MGCWKRVKVRRKYADFLFDLERKPFVRVESRKLQPIAQMMCEFAEIGRTGKGYSYVVKVKPFKVVRATKHYFIVTV